jgi:hypothetical protein
MKTLKKVVFALLVAVSIGGVSTSAMAEASEGRITYKPAEAIDLVLKRILAAQNAIETGQDPDSVAKLVNEALNGSKEINANDKVDMARMRANNILKKAKGHAKSGSFQEADAELREAHKAFSDLKGML